MPRLYKMHPLEGIADRRTLLKIRAVDIAAALGIEVASYRRMERGERRCYLDKALAIADMLDCTVPQLGVIPDADERIRLFGVSESRRALGAAAGWVDPEDDFDDLEHPIITRGLRPKDALTDHIIVNRKAPGRKATPAPAPIEPSISLTVEAKDIMPGPDPVSSIIGDWLNDDAPDTLVLPDAPEENGLVDLPHQGITPIHAAEDDEPDLPADPMAKYVTQWKGDA